MVRLLELEITSQTLVTTLVAVSGVTANDDLALDLASSAGQLHLPSS